MPCGMQIYDEALLAGRLWTPRQIWNRITAWYDFSDPVYCIASAGSVKKLKDLSTYSDVTLLTGTPTQTRSIKSPESRRCLIDLGLNNGSTYFGLTNGVAIPTSTDASTISAFNRVAGQRSGVLFARSAYRYPWYWYSDNVLSSTFQQNGVNIGTADTSAGDFVMVVSNKWNTGTNCWKNGTQFGTQQTQSGITQTWTSLFDRNSELASGKYYEEISVNFDLNQYPTIRQLLEGYMAWKHFGWQNGLPHCN